MYCSRFFKAIWAALIIIFYTVTWHGLLPFFTFTSIWWLLATPFYGLSILYFVRMIKLIWIRLLCLTIDLLFNARYHFINGLILLVNILGQLIISVPVVVLFGLMPVVMFGIIILTPFYFVASYLEPIGGPINVAFILYIIIKRSKYLSELLNRPRVSIEKIEKEWEGMVIDFVASSLYKLQKLFIYI